MSNNKQQTAVEWLQDILESFGNKHEIQMTWSTLEGLLSRAKEMEKQQQGKTWDEAIDEDSRYNTFEQYYNETYNK
jgi:hypothetical protein